MRTILVLCLMACVVNTFGQYESRYWIFGRPTLSNSTNANFDFYPGGSIYSTSPNPSSSTVPPVISVPLQPNTVSSLNGFESWAIATEPNSGDLLFYTDGVDLFSSSHSRVNSGFFLGANPSAAQPVAICQLPNSQSFSPQLNEYLIFINPTGVNSNNITLEKPSYWKYSPATGVLNGPFVMPGSFSNSETAEGMIIVPNPGENSYWLIQRLAHAQGNNSVYTVYKIDFRGVSFHNSFVMGPSTPVGSDRKSPIGNFTYRKVPESNMVKLGVAISRFATQTPNTLIIADFDPITGNLNTSPRVFTFGTNGIFYDVELSPNARFAYYSSYFPLAIYQLDLQATNPTPQIITNLGHLRGGGLKLGPDGYIYCITNGLNFNTAGAATISRIIQPDIPRPVNMSSFYQSSVMSVNNTFIYNFPEFLPSNQLGTSIKEEAILEDWIRFQQGENWILTSWDEDVRVDEIELLDISGKSLKVQQNITTNRIRTSLNFPKGVYLLKISSTEGPYLKKIIVKGNQ
ncbi:MAG: T9SS type A sorting domain-containing protein [Bacteroidia bacterium]|nr:T9SS type A sorting domain-containing protein [Bacteroidia bacterium]